jgi:hypothetical protein
LKYYKVLTRLVVYIELDHLAVQNEAAPQQLLIFSASGAPFLFVYAQYAL